MGNTLYLYPGLDAVTRRAVSDTVYAARMIDGDFSHLGLELSTKEHGILVAAYREFILLPSVERTIEVLIAKMAEIIRRQGARGRPN